MKNLILLRGLPGAGKSTLAESLVGGAGSEHFEADQYFVDRDGNYNFDVKHLKYAHKWCKSEVEFAMEFGHRSFMGIHEPSPLATIVVSNTFTQEWEMKPYFELAEKYGYTVHSLIVENRHGNMNEHNVPKETIEKMNDRFEVKLK